MKWIDTSEHDFLLTAMKLSDGKQALILTGIAASDGGPYAKEFKELNFVKTKSNLWFSLHYSTADGLFKGLDVERFQKHFPLAVERDVLESEIFRSPDEIKELLNTSVKSVTPVEVADLHFDTKGFDDSLTDEQRHQLYKNLTSPIQFGDRPVCSRYDLVHQLIDSNFFIEQITLPGKRDPEWVLKNSQQVMLTAAELSQPVMDYACYLHNKWEDELVNRVLSKYDLPTLPVSAAAPVTTPAVVIPESVDASIEQLPAEMQQEYLDAEDELQVFLKMDHPYYLSGDIRETRKKKAYSLAEKLEGDYRIVRRYDYSEWYVRPHNSCAVVVLFPMRKGELAPHKETYYAEDKGSNIELTYLSKIAHENKTKSFNDLSEMSEWLRKGGVLAAEKELAKEIEKQREQEEKQRIAHLPFLMKEREFFHGQTIEELISRNIEYFKEQLSVSRRNCTHELSNALHSKLQLMREEVSTVSILLEEAVKTGIFDINKIPDTYPFIQVELMRIEQDRRFEKLSINTLDIGSGRSNIDAEAVALLKRYSPEHLKDLRKQFSHLIEQRMEFCNYSLGKKIYHYQNKDEMQYRQLLDAAIKLSGNDEIMVNKLVDNTNYMTKQELAAAEWLDEKGFADVSSVKEELDRQIKQRMRDTHRAYGNNPWDYMTNEEMDTYHVIEIATELHQLKQEQLKELTANAKPSDTEMFSTSVKKIM